MGFTFEKILMKKHTLLFALLLISWGIIWAQTNLPSGFAQTLAAEGLNPTSMALAPDGRIFLAQKDGRVLICHVVENQLHTQPFVTLSTDAFNERGLNGIALHPDFEMQPWVYLYYTLPGEQRNRISRVRANGDFAVPGSEQVLLDLDDLSGSIHNAGAMVFGADGKLYIGAGDGAKSANAQSLATTLGKILRINPDGSIPPGNPFYHQLTGDLRAIYAYGVRNPFSMSSDPVSGKIYFCDVGAEAWEEVNELRAGANYGWKTYQGPSGDPAFQDPIYAYRHTEGCAIVGAAFAFQGNPLVPAKFQGKFLFADYCRGWIRALDLTSGVLVDSFATGIDRPVSLLATPTGELWYLARAGLGGGSQIDNTASTEGSLWRVFWAGEGAPRFATQPQALLVAEGESAVFRAQAFGGQPIRYQWFLNGDTIPNTDSTVLILNDLALADSGSVVRCTAFNALGTDTSQTALLGVSSNRRPLPEIVFPLENAWYRGGDTLRFAGRAHDPEEGPLPAERLTWRIDLHHATHAHPALPTTPSIAEGQFVVPQVGETSTDVFLRIYLSARDAKGFEKTTHRDVFPQKMQIKLKGPTGILVNVDGQNFSFPAEVESVVGLMRTLQVPEFQRVGNMIHRFDHWSDGSTESLRTFVAPDTTLMLEAVFSNTALGNGTGLLGQYFIDPQGDFDEPPTLTRTDTTINFIWNAASPDTLLSADYFTVRWTGFVQPLFSETYVFSVSSDDGCRLWVGDSLLIDQWVPQATTQHSAAVSLNAEYKYRIRLEYLEIGGGANAQMFWSSPRQTREIVPKRQLYPPLYAYPATLRGNLGLDADNDGAWEANEPTFAGAEVRLFNADTDTLLAVTKSLAGGRYAFTDLPSGNFYLSIKLPPTADVFLPVQNVDADGRTPVQKLDEGELLTLPVAWAVTAIALGGDVWLDEDRDSVKDPAEPLLAGITVLLYRADSVLLSAGMTSPEGRYGFSLLAPGKYFLVFLHQWFPEPLVPGFGLNAQGQTLPFEMVQGQYRVQDVGFVLPPVSDVGETAEDQGFDLKVYPNPAGDAVWLESNGANAKLLRASVVDATGRRQVEREWEFSASRIQLDLRGLPTGAYILVLENDRGGRAVRRLIKGR